MSEENKALPEISAPPPALKRLARLVGNWYMTGRSLTSDKDNITGTAKFEWLPGGYFLKNDGNIEVDGFKFWSMEIIGYDPAIDAFTSHVYSSMESQVRVYHWDFQGDTLTHWEATSRYTGTISADGKTIAGGWRPLEGHESNEGNTYDALMTRVE
jgi:hypothetical protein